MNISNKILNINYVDLTACVILSFLVVANGVLNKAVGEMFSEGLAVSVTIILFLTQINFKISRKYIVPALIIIYYIASSVVEIIISENYKRFIFLYTYIFFLFLMINNKKNENLFNSYYLIYSLIFFGIISSLYALLQRAGFNTILPLEGAVRATGLSRSSLNLTGCLVSVFSIAIIILKDNFYKIIICVLLFLGILASGGRGGIVSSILLFIIVYFNKRNNIKLIIILSIIIILLVIFFNDWIFRIFSAFDFKNDPSNIDRTQSYLKFFDEFEFFGGGVGTTNPAAGRFYTTTGFESSALNFIYEMGVINLILLTIAFMIWYKKLININKKNIFLYLFSLNIIIFGQQLYGIPSCFCILIITLRIVMIYNKK